LEFSAAAPPAPVVGILAAVDIPAAVDVIAATPIPMPRSEPQAPPAPPKKKHVDFAPGVPLDTETALISLLTIVLQNGECFDGEDAEQILSVVQKAQDVSRKQRMRQVSVARDTLCKHLASLIAQREKMLQDAMNKNLLRPDDVLFEFFVEKQAMLLKQLQTMQAM
jgi:hypothetical protein